MMLKGERDVALAEQAKAIVGKLPARMNASETSEHVNRLARELHKLLIANADLTSERDELRATLEEEREIHVAVKADRDMLQSMRAVDEHALRSRVGWLLDNVCQATWLTFGDTPPNTTEVKVDGRSVIGATINTPLGTFQYNLDDGLLKVVPKAAESDKKPGEKKARPVLDLRVDRKGIFPVDELALWRYLNLLPSRVSPRTREFLPEETPGSMPSRFESVSPETLRQVIGILRNKMGMEIIPVTWVETLRVAPLQL
jgi:hypothetical protein